MDSIEALQAMENLADSLLKKSEDLKSEKECKDEESKTEPPVVESKEGKEEDNEVKKSVETSTEAVKSGTEKANGDNKTGESKKEPETPAKTTDSDESDFEKSQITDAVDVSEFLGTLTKSIVDTMGGFKKSLTDSQELSDKNTVSFAKSLGVMMKSQVGLLENHSNLQKSLGDLTKSIAAMQTRIEELETQPVMRKSVATSQAVDKNFQKSLGNTAMEELTKSQVLEGLTTLAMQPNSGVTANDVLSVESGAPVSDTAMAKVRQLYNK